MKKIENRLIKIKSRKVINLKVVNRNSILIIYHQISQNLISTSNIILKIAKNFANLLIFIGLFSSKMNSEWIIIKLTTKNNKE